MKEPFGEKRSKKMNMKVSNILGIGLLLLSVFGCGSEENEGSDHNPQTSASCDSVSWLGASFEFPKGLRIDSVSCMKNSIKSIDLDLFKDKEANTVTIHDTFLYKNEYKLLLFSQGKQTALFIKKIVFKPRAVYHGEVCDLTSCEVNNEAMKRDTGPFKITVTIMQK
jgi:hypothetical protein